jgi:hypothetical protein
MITCVELKEKKNEIEFNEEEVDRQIVALQKMKLNKKLEQLKRTINEIEMELQKMY